ncbi:hypothetical protein [Janibacter sp. GXQ6167]|uniref:hypothetical protein n=1 Tax=Janibacter sp. GXQ6167 TaxID=3240791 RepID=UPI003526C20C
MTPGNLRDPDHLPDMSRGGMWSLRTLNPRQPIPRTVPAFARQAPLEGLADGRNFEDIEVVPQRPQVSQQRLEVTAAELPQARSRVGTESRAGADQDVRE